MSGLAAGLAFSLWIGFGGPKPPIPSLPQDTSGCIFNNQTLPPDEWNMLNSTTLPPSAAVPYYFPLYKLSYMWYAPLGFLVTIVTAQIVSRIATKFRASRSLFGSDIDPDLLSPCFPLVFRGSRVPDQDLTVKYCSLLRMKHLNLISFSFQLVSQKTADPDDVVLTKDESTKI